MYTARVLYMYRLSLLRVDRCHAITWCVICIMFWMCNVFREWQGSEFNIGYMYMYYVRTCALLRVWRNDSYG